MKEGLAFHWRGWWGGGGGGGGGLFLGIRCGGMSSASRNPDPISHKKIGIFDTLFQTWYR